MAKDTQCVRVSLVMEVPAKDAKAANDLLDLVLEKFFRVNAREVQHYDTTKEAMRDYDIGVAAVVEKLNKRLRSDS